MKIYLATWLEDPMLNAALTKQDARSRLLSYYYTAPREGEFPVYIATGNAPYPPNKHKE